MKTGLSNLREPLFHQVTTSKPREFELSQSIPIFKPASRFMTQDSVLNLSKPCDLLAKRYNSADLGDLITKKIKTRGSNIPEKFPLELKKDFENSDSKSDEPKGLIIDGLMTGDCNPVDLQSLKTKAEVEHDSNLSNASPSTASTQSSHYESNSELLHLNGKTAGISIHNESLPIVPVFDGYCQLLLALEALKAKIVAQREAGLLNTGLESKDPEESLYIPPKPLCLGQDTVYDLKGDRNELVVSCGPVQFPFLTNSCGFSQGNDFEEESTSSLPDLSKMLNSLQKILEVRQESPEEKEKSPVQIEQKNEKILPANEEALESLSATRAETLRSEIESGTSVKETIKEIKSIQNKEVNLTTNKRRIKIKACENTEGNKITDQIKSKEKTRKKENEIDKDKERAKERERVKEREREREREIEKEKEKEQEKRKIIMEKEKKGKERERVRPKEDYEDVYARPSYFSRRQAERKKNKWQLEQDEKVKGIQFMPPLFKESSELMFEGHKKKSSFTSVGPDHQVDMTVISRSRTTSRREPHLKWDPLFHKRNELQNFFGTVKRLLKRTVNQEKLINLILKNDNDLKKTLTLIKTDKNKTEIVEDLILNTTK